MKKKLTKEIRTLAAKLPDSYVEGVKYRTQEIQDLRQREVKNSMFGQSIEQSISKENETIIVKGTTLFKVNHERRIKRAYLRDGIPGIKAYIKWVDANNKLLNAKYRNSIVLNLVNEKLKASISEIF
jgi:hypothetical protein